MVVAHDGLTREPCIPRKYSLLSMLGPEFGRHFSLTFCYQRQRLGVHDTYNDSDVHG